MPRFRLMYGHHVGDHPEDLRLPGYKRRQVRFNQGAIVDTDQDLLQLNGRAGDAKKFEMLDGQGAPTAPSALTWNPKAETIDQYGLKIGENYNDPDTDPRFRPLARKIGEAKAELIRLWKAIEKEKR